MFCAILGGTCVPLAFLTVHELTQSLTAAVLRYAGTPHFWSSSTLVLAANNMDMSVKEPTRFSVPFESVVDILINVPLFLSLILTEVSM